MGGLFADLLSVFLTTSENGDRHRDMSSWHGLVSLVSLVPPQNVQVLASQLTNEKPREPSRERIDHFQSFHV